MVQKHIISCCNPKRILNRYTGEWLTVGCGKCEACHISRHERAVAMMKEEESHHKYAFFCTLTYNDRFVPKLYRSSDGLFLYDPDREHRDLECIPIQDDMLSFRDINWLRRKKYFEYSRYSDFQRFLKRFRQNFVRLCPFDDIIKQLKLTGNYAQIRYYGSAEYGPETIRPHFHCILFFDSDWLAENFGEVFSKSWSVFDRRTNQSICIGERSTFRPCKSDGTDRYTASYCDGIVGIPEFYKCKELRPKHSFSKTPALGTLSYDSTKISQVFHSGALRDYSGVNIKTGESIIDFLPRSVENKLFPKCCGFSRIDDRCRMFLYRILWFVSKRNGGSVGYPDFRDYILAHRDYFEDLPRLGSIFQLQYHLRKPYYNLWFVSRRFLDNCILLFGVPADEVIFSTSDNNSFQQTVSVQRTYLKIIVEYYSLKEYYRLRDFYEFAEEFSKRESYRFAFSLHENAPRDLEAKLSDSKDFLNVCVRSKKIYNDGCKSKKERDRQNKGNALEYTPDDSYSTNESLLHLFNQVI